MIDAFHLPGLTDPPTGTREFGPAGASVELRVPALTPPLLGEQIDALLAARDRGLAGRPISEVVRAIDAVARRLLDPADALRREAESTLPAVTGASPQMVARVLDGMAADWRAPRLEALLAAELGDARALDGFVLGPFAVPGTRLRAVGPVLSTHFFSGNIPGIGVTSLIRALLVKSAALGKTAAGEPVLPVLFARGLAEVDSALGECVAVAYWPGGDEALEGVALAASDAVIAYGGSDAVGSVRARTPPQARFLGYGNKVSFGVVAREALTRSAAPGLADAAALAVATFDQQGCVSPHLFYAEEGGEVEPVAWARLIAASLERLEAELPRGRIGTAETAAIQQLRGAAEFAGLGGGGVELITPPGSTAWTVIHDEDPAFEPSCLNRVVRVKPVAALAEVPALVAPLRSVLQTVGVEGPTERVGPLVEALAVLGASRCAPFSAMPWPPPTWHHDGRPPLRDLVRWCDWE